ncbi:hypothetical protein [Nocardia blacklockiae]|uniref:hypothetical protein n=1 Tax=Nocardia blacklockiae TaxID=480036 RepID=UPI0018956087|nr:hypothetical protein [Nocardia blacklockiae]MBF6175150.1 hypothetical protein [Nocardia blacklockiae]
MFVGHAGLLQVIRRLVREPLDSGDDPDPTPHPPVLVLQGAGGSGRTAVLEEALHRLAKETRVELIRPLRVTDVHRERPGPRHEPSPLRPVHVAITLGLGRHLDGYPLALRRTAIALLACKTDLAPIPADERPQALRAELARLWNTRQLNEFLDELQRSVTPLVATAAPLPGAAMWAALTGIGVVARGVQRKRWSHALDWFGHQDLGLAADPVQELVHLSMDARTRHGETEQSIDESLTLALLADLRETVTQARRRRPNLLILLDDGDSPAAVAFTRSLLRARESLARAGSPTTDPVALVTTTGGTLPAALGALPAPTAHTEAELATRAGGIDARIQPWITVDLDPMRVEDVQLLVNDIDRHSRLGVAAAVHGVSHGHAAATVALLDEIRRTPGLLTTETFTRDVDFDALLGTRTPGDRTTLAETVLRVIARGLADPDRRGHGGSGPDETHLAVASVARNPDEARALTDLLAAPDRDAPLFTSPYLWTPRRRWTDIGPDGECMHPLVGYLGRRVLAADAKTWNAACGRLLARAVSYDDRAGRLHFERLLGNDDAVIRALDAQLHAHGARAWLDLFDEVTYAWAPHRPVPDTPGHDADTTRGQIAVLTAVVPRLEHDPTLVDPDRWRDLRRRAGSGFKFLARHVEDRGPFDERAERYGW